MIYGVGQPGPARRLDRHAVVELSLRQWRRVSRRRTGRRRSTATPGVKALDAIHDQHRQVRPARRGELLLRRGLQRDGAGQGLQLHHLQLLPRRPSTIRRSRRWSARSRSCRSGPDPGRRQPQRRAGAGPSRIRARTRTRPGPSSSGSSRRRSPRSARSPAARRPAPTCSTIPRCSAKYPYCQALKALLLTSQKFPTFTYTPEFVEVLGRELNLAVDRREGRPSEALATAATEFNKLAKKDGKLK